MITLPNGLEHFMKGKDLTGLKPFALLYRNKWDSVNNKYNLETTPIDISDLIVKPNTLSMTLDVNEVAQYNANNVTLTLSDTKNYFVEGTPNSYFPAGYQIYGSRVELYYGTDATNRTKLFTGVIKDLPTHKPEKYQVDLKLLSPLEMLKDIEAKEFSNKVIGETLTYVSTDNDGHRIYRTSGYGVGGFNGIYANGTKLFDGVDYEVDNVNSLQLQAKITIINSSYYTSTITADYYKWKTDLSVENIVAGLVGLAGYNSTNEDIRAVVWNSAVRNPPQISSVVAGIGYYPNGLNKYKFNWHTAVGSWNNTVGISGRAHYLPSNFDYTFDLHLTTQTLEAAQTAVSIGDGYNGNTITWPKPISQQGFQNNLNIGPVGVYNGLTFRQVKYNAGGMHGYPAYFLIYRVVNGVPTLIYQETAAHNSNDFREHIDLVRRGSSVVIYRNGTQILSLTDSTSYQFDYQYIDGGRSFNVEGQTWNIYNSSLYLSR